ncbi:DUF2946 family protein [Kiloniella sp.]|uniref:DUF2946 family protein n=1 Tax=Kiloniella sp. TaxID=1938587 RepID=UPI003A8FE799
MPRQDKQIAKQDKQSIAALSIFALCFKLFLPIFISFFISIQTTASPLTDSNDAQVTLEKSLGFICTSSGIDQNQQNDSSSTTLTDHCDHCLTCAFYTLQRNTDKRTAPLLVQSTLSWRVIGSNQAKLPLDDQRHSSRAPPRA